MFSINSSLLAITVKGDLELLDLCSILSMEMYLNISRYWTSNNIYMISLMGIVGKYIYINLNTFTVQYSKVLHITCKRFRTKYFF